MTRTGRAPLACVAAVVFAGVTACGSESDGEAVASAIAADLRSQDAFAGHLGQDSAGCVGEEIVAALGVDDARDLGRPDDTRDEDRADFELGDLSAEEIAAVGDAVETCVDDIEDVVVDLVAAGVADTAGRDLPVGEAEARCVGREVADRLSYGRLLALGIGGAAGDTQLGEGEAEAYARSFLACVDVREVLLDSVRADGTDAGVVACLDREISDAAIGRFFEDWFRDADTTTDEAFAPAIETCTAPAGG